MTAEADERTAAILDELDMQLTIYLEMGEDFDPFLHDKIMHTIRWVSEYLDPETVGALIDSLKLENGDAIKALINDPYFHLN